VDHEELVTDGETLGQVGVLGEQVLGVPDLEQRGHEIDLSFLRRGLDAVEVLEILGVHQREMAEVRILQENGVEAELHRAVHERDQPVDVLRLFKVEGVVNPLLAEGERLEDGNRRRRGRAAAEQEGRHETGSHAAGCYQFPRRGAMT